MKFSVNEIYNAVVMAEDQLHDLRMAAEEERMDATLKQETLDQYDTEVADLKRLKQDLIKAKGETLYDQEG